MNQLDILGNCITPQEYKTDVNKQTQNRLFTRLHDTIVIYLKIQENTETEMKKN